MNEKKARMVGGDGLEASSKLYNYFNGFVRVEKAERADKRLD
jgi:hypothetical protein